MMCTMMFSRLSLYFYKCPSNEPYAIVRLHLFSNMPSKAVNHLLPSCLLNLVQKSSWTCETKWSL